MSKKKETVRTTSPPTEQPAEKQAAPKRRRYEYTGPFCINLVLRNPSETIQPLAMDDDAVEAFIKRRPSAAKYWKETT